MSKLRETKDIIDANHWIIPANLEGYDLHGAFKNFTSLDWHYSKSTKNIKVGDIVYIYMLASLRVV